jgi:hypothetical protein
MKNIKLIMAALAMVAIVVAAFAVVSAAHDAGHAGDGAASCKMHGPQAIIFTISAGSVNGQNVTFSIPETARVSKDNKVKLTSFDRPLKGMLNTSSGIAKISTADFIPSTSRTDFMNNTSIPVAGATVLVALEDLNMTHSWDGNKTCNCHGNKSCSCCGNKTGDMKGNKTCHCHDNMTMGHDGRHSIEFSKVVVELPNGSTKTYKLDKPVKIVYMKQKNMAIIEASPELASAMADILQSGQTFPANSAPMPLTKIPIAT